MIAVLSDKISIKYIHDYADAKQNALEIRTSLFFRFFLHGSRKLLRKLLLVLTQYGRLHVVSLETASRDAQTLNLSQNVSNFMRDKLVVG